MKFVTISFFLISFFGSSQDSSPFSFSMPVDQEVYRGIDNYVEINPGSSNDEYELKCPTCDSIYKTTIENTYIIHAGKGKYVELIAISTEDPKTVLAKHKLPCFYLPDPVLFFGGVKSGGKCSKSAYHIFAKYPPEFNLDETFDIIDWKVFAGEEKFVGEGRKLTQETRDYLISMRPGDGIAIIAVVKGPDGIARRIAGAYSL